MDRFKEFLKDNTFIKGSFFIIFNAALLCFMYFIIKNFNAVTSDIYKVIATLLDAFWPLILGLILAYLLNPLAELIDTKFLCRVIKKPDDPVKAGKRRGMQHLLSVLLTYLLVAAAVIALIYGFAAMILGRVSVGDVPATFSDLMSGIIKYESVFQKWITTNIPSSVLSDKLTDVTNAVMQWIGTNINASSVISFFKNFSGSLLDILVGIIISIYLMKDKNLFLNLWHRFLHLIMPNKGHDALSETLHEVNEVLSKFIRGALLDALIVAVLSSIGLSIMGLEAAVFIGIFAGIANIIPYFGPVIGMIPAFLMGFCTEGFWHGVLAVVILFAIQQIDANFIYPKVVGSSTGLHPLAVLLSVSVFGYFGGILGMILAVPLAGIIQIFVLRWFEERERRINENIQDDAEQQAK